MNFYPDNQNELALKQNNTTKLNIEHNKCTPSINRINKDLYLDGSYKLTHATICNLENTIPRDITLQNEIPEISLTDNARFCLKTLVSPLAIFFHIGKFAISSISTTLSFAVAFGVSDFIFFWFLDKFSLTYPRYVLLGVTGVVALFSVKGIASSFINIFLSFFKGTYSWYFSLINPDCSFCDFLLGRNKITTNKSR